VTFDAEQLYLACRASDPDPSGIRAHLMDRDAIDTFVQDDHVGFMIDTFNDQRRAFPVPRQPARRPGGRDLQRAGWGGGLVVGHDLGVRGQNWPRRLCGRSGHPVQAAPLPGVIRAADVGLRGVPVVPAQRPARISSRFTDRSSSCILCQENKVAGFEGIAPGRNIELDPTATAQRTDERANPPEGPMEIGKVTGDLGLTARWGMTSNLVLSGAVNPDFSQVEADVAQLDVNTPALRCSIREAAVLPRGPRFLHDAVPGRLHEDRGRPAAGLKVTGKAGRQRDWRLRVTRDRLNNLIIPSNEASDLASTDDDVTGTVVRYRRDVGRQSTIGLLYTGREADAYHNRVFGPDAFVRFSASDTVQFQFLRSDTQYPQQVADEHGQQTDVGGGNAVFASTSTWGGRGCGWGTTRISIRRSAATAGSCRAWTCAPARPSCSAGSGAAPRAGSRARASVRARSSRTTTPAGSRTRSARVRELHGALPVGGLPETSGWTRRPTRA